MKQTILPLAALLCILPASAKSQLTSRLVGSPTSCRNEANDLEVTYTAQNRFTNQQKTPIVVAMGKDPDLTFFLFKGRQSTDAKDAVQWHNEDSVTPPPVAKRTLKPGESIEWTRLAIIITRDGDTSSRVPQPGDYFLLPFPDIQIIRPATPPIPAPTTNDFLPIHIPQPNAPPCRK